MKLKSLILGSVAAAGLSTAGFAADLSGVLTSLDVCDSLGLSGLTISSDTNCLQISGGVEYEFNWGNFADTLPIASLGTVSLKNRDASSDLGLATGDNDWNSKVVAWLKFVGTSSSDFGPAKVVIKLKNENKTSFNNGVGGVVDSADGLGVDGNGDPVGFAAGKDKTVFIDEAYVSVGDATVISAGRKGSIFNKGDDEAYNFLGLFAEDKEDKGVIGSDEYYGFFPAVGGHVIQLETSFGDGIGAKLGLEALEKKGTLVGVLDYKGDTVTAHVSGALGGILDGVEGPEDNYAIHSGVTAAFDAFKVRAAFAFGGNTRSADETSFYNGLLSAQGTFDMFTIAASAEVLSFTDAAGARDTGYGFGGSVGATVSEGIALNLGGRYFADSTADTAAGYQVAVQLVADVTETIQLTGELGVYGRTDATVPAVVAGESDFYGSAKLGWNPGGGFSSSVGATVQQNGAYKVTFKAAKSFE